MNSRLILIISVMLWSVQGVPLEAEHHHDEEAEDVGYYWKDFHGQIPKDALKAGKDAKGNSVYIGQVLHNGVLIPGRIASNEKELSFEWGSAEYKTDKNVKILCSPHPEQYEWIKTDTKGIKTLEKKFIKGGYEPGNGETTYIGKVFEEDADDIGKLLVSDNEFSGLHTTKDGKAIQHTEFEALYYNPDIPIHLASKLAEVSDNVNNDTVTHHVSAQEGCGPRVININID